MVSDYISEMRELIGNRELLVPGTRAVILNSKQQILLELRSDFKKWGLPGGSADPGEEICQTIRREVYEETGLILEKVSVFGFSSSPGYERFSFPNGDRVHSFNLLFWANTFTGQLVRNPNESNALDWFDLNNLPEMLPNMGRTVKAFEEFQTSNKFQIV